VNLAAVGCDILHDSFFRISVGMKNTILDHCK